MTLKRSCFFLFCLLIIVKILSVNSTTNFDEFISKYNKSYINGSVEYLKRLQIFLKSVRRITLQNKNRDENETVLYGINALSDLHPIEFKSKYLQDLRKSSELFYSKFRKKFEIGNKLESKNVSISTEIDWRDKGVVTNIKNQQACGACWAFSVVETVESMYGIKYSKLKEMSVQQVIDCDSTGQSCQGGDICSTAKWLVNENIKLHDEIDYPLKNIVETCQLKPEKNGTTLRNYSCQRFVSYEEQLLQLIETHGPVTAAVDATLWQDYMGGIIQNHCYQNVNHAVEIVGFNRTGPVPYYIIRNSWGSSFGDNGYAYVKIGANVCGIAQQILSLDVN